MLFEAMAKMYFVSRFPRFMSSQWALHACEPGYVLHDLQTLRAHIARLPALNNAPRSYEDFAKATRNDAHDWPCLYVHRVNQQEFGSGPGDLLPANRAREGAHFVGNIVDVRKILEEGGSLNKFRRISVGGTNRFEVPFPRV